MGDQLAGGMAGTFVRVPTDVRQEVQKKYSNREMKYHRFPVNTGHIRTDEGHCFYVTHWYWFYGDDPLLHELF